MNANKFALELLRALIAESPAANHFICPYSIVWSLLIAMEGARNNTAHEMGEALGLLASMATNDIESPWNFETSREELSHIGSLIETPSNVQSMGHDCLWHNANGLWVDRHCKLHNLYSRLMRDRYQATIELADFKSSAEYERKSINAWVSERTAHKITELIPSEGISRDSLMVIVNAVYLRGKWISAFDSNRTRLQPFLNHGFDRVFVPMLSQQCKTCRYGAFNFDSPMANGSGKGIASCGVQVLEVGLRGDNLNVWFILPRESNGLKQLIANIQRETLEAWHSQLVKRDVELVLPRFTTDSDYDLRTALEMMGIRTALQPGEADFSGMCDEKMYLSKVIHKACIEIDEQGTEAAAATAALMLPTGAMQIHDALPRFVVDHPFIIMIRHSSTGAILFAGVVQALEQES